MERITTSMVYFDRNKLTDKEMEIIKNHPQGIEVNTTFHSISVIDPEWKNQEFMIKMIDLLYKVIKRK